MLWVLTIIGVCFSFQNLLMIMKIYDKKYSNKDCIIHGILVIETIAMVVGIILAVKKG